MDIHKMKGAINCVILFSIVSFPSFGNFECKLSESIISLSGPVSFILKELALEDDPKLLAVSSYHHYIDHKVKLSGGIYLSSKKLYQFKKPYQIFIDESYELERNLKLAQKRHPSMRGIYSVLSKGVSNFTLTEKILSIIEKITSDCSFKISKLKKKMKMVKESLKHAKFSNDYIFRLGGNQKEKMKSFIIANDLLVTELRTNSSFKTLESSLAYFLIAQKESKKKTEDKVWVSLKQKNREFKILRQEAEIIIEGRDVLTPGLSQIYLIENFLNFLFPKTSENKN